MVDAGVTGVLAKLGEVASAEATALLRVDDQIRELRRRLVYQQRRGRASELLLLWAQETREVALEVEDAVDEFHLKVEAFQAKARPRRGRHSWYHSALTLLSGLAMQIVARHGLSREITKINARIKEISEIKETYQIQSSPAEIWSASSIDAADADWDIEADNAIELRGQEFAALKTHILEKQSKIERRAVISIVGPSGIGKTTLARKLYDDRGVREHFKVRAWISLPARIRFEKYLEMMYEQVRKQVPEDLQHGDGDASGKLQQLLREHEHNYLVVLDGLVDISDWNSLVSLLPDDNPRSRILLTTQLKVKEIKPSVKQIAPVVLQPLGSTGDGKDILKLFYRRAFGFGANSIRPRVMSNLSERILKISAGLPLAVVVLSGLLRTKNFGHEWNEVLEQLEESKGQPVKCLWTLAFEDLPHHLKSCFMYFAMASDNILLDPDRLVRLWIAEGFVAPKKGKTLEEVGLGYLKQLISRGLVQAVKDARGGIKFVSVHSLLHAFAEAESQESGFFEMHHHANVLKPHSVRRLALHNYVDSYVDIPNHFPKLRSLFCDFLEDQKGGDNGSSSVHQGEWHPAEWFLRACGNSESPAGSTKLHDLSFIRGSRFLRVIDLYGLLLARVPDEVGSIIHLRYLGIRNCKLAALPASISKLDNLQTLDVRATQVQDVADEFWEIQGLRHVLADVLRLPKCLSAHLKHLQTLAGAVPAGAWGLSCPLSSMIYLRSLAMSLISEEHVSALSQALEKMEFLVSLKLAGRLLPSSVFTNSSSRRLEVLALHGRLDAGDSMHGPFFLPNLGTLSISGSALKQDFIDKVATLPNLAEMELLGGSYSEAHLVCPAEGFQSLRKLKLANLAQLEFAVVPAPESTLFTCRGCPLLKVERLQQVAAADPAENGILSRLEEPEFKDERPYIFSEIDQAAANDPTEDQMLVRRGVKRFFQVDTADDPMEDQMLVRHGMEGLQYRELFQEDTADDRAEDQMLLRRGKKGLQYSEHFQEDTADDPSKDQMPVRRGMEGLQSREEFKDDTADDGMEDQMLVRRGMEGLQDTEHRQEDTADDPTEDQMLVRHGM